MKFYNLLILGIGLTSHSIGSSSSSEQLPHAHTPQMPNKMVEEDPVQITRVSSSFLASQLLHPQTQGASQIFELQDMRKRIDHLEMANQMYASINRELSEEFARTHQVLHEQHEDKKKLEAENEQLKTQVADQEKRIDRLELALLEKGLECQELKGKFETGEMIIYGQGGEINKLETENAELRRKIEFLSHQLQEKDKITAMSSDRLQAVQKTTTPSRPDTPDSTRSIAGMPISKEPLPSRPRSNSF